VLHPTGNLVAQRAAELYRTCLSDEGAFTAWALEFFDASADVGAGPWVQAVNERYVG
jgi:hypothetical protein